MSRIGKIPVEIPDGVKVSKSGNEVKVEGPLGTMKQRIDPVISVEIEDDQVSLGRYKDTKDARSKHGLYRSLILNMIEGVTKGFSKKLVIYGRGYKAEMSGKSLNLSVGHSHPVVVEPPEGIEFEVGERGGIYVKGVDKQLVGQVAAKIRSIHPPEPYIRKPEPKKGIFYDKEYVKLKVGKSGA